MTREEFIQILDRNKYSYEEYWDKIIINHNRSVSLTSVKSIPSNIEFSNQGALDLGGVKEISSGVEFRNQGYVLLPSLKSIPSNTIFASNGGISLDSLDRIPIGVIFDSSNGGKFFKHGIYLKSLIGGYFDEWDGMIEGTNPISLLNKMISLGLFDRK